MGMLWRFYELYWDFVSSIYIYIGNFVLDLWDFIEVYRVSFIEICGILLKFIGFLLTWIGSWLRFIGYYWYTYIYIYIYIHIHIYIYTYIYVYIYIYIHIHIYIYCVYIYIYYTYIYIIYWKFCVGFVRFYWGVSGFFYWDLWDSIKVYWVFIDMDRKLIEVYWILLMRVYIYIYIYIYTYIFIYIYTYIHIYIYTYIYIYIYCIYIYIYYTYIYIHIYIYILHIYIYYTYIYILYIYILYIYIMFSLGQISSVDYRENSIVKKSRVMFLSFHRIPGLVKNDIPSSWIDVHYIYKDIYICMFMYVYIYIYVYVYTPIYWLVNHSTKLDKNCSNEHAT